MGHAVEDRCEQVGRAHYLQLPAFGLRLLRRQIGGCFPAC
jgi:hypothetical protein